MEDTPKVVTIVDAIPGGARAEVEVIALDEDIVTVRAGAEARRFSRISGFEIRPGGSWSTWRLAGSDFRLLRRKR
ncbi:MAG: hypothetical protein U0414_40550 [Polyangiaceae bacterium]